MKKFLSLVLVMTFVGCSGKLLRKSTEEPQISNPFSALEKPEKNKKGIVVKRSFGANSVEIALADTEEETLIRYPLSELKEGATPDPSLADNAVLKSKSTDNESVDQKAPSSATPRQSYLLGIAKIKKLYRKRDYELALVHLEPLLSTYPNDIKLLSLRGTISSKLQFYKLAEESWKKALLLDPTNQPIKRALNQLKRKTMAKKQ